MLLKFYFQVQKRGRSFRYVDASDTRTSNWMRYVNSARHKGEENIVAFQYKGNIYYATSCFVPENVELLVWCGNEFNKGFKNTSADVGQSPVQEIFDDSGTKIFLINFIRI